MMGSGKSSIGRRVAKRLRRRHVDLDSFIERASGKKIAELFASEGEALFRDREHDALREVLADQEPLVVSTGGGSVLRDDNRAAMRAAGTVVWLRASPQSLLARVGDGSGRPLLAGDPLGNLTRIATEREGVYAAAAHEIIDVDRLSSDAVSDRVARLVGRPVPSAIAAATPYVVEVALGRRTYTVLVGAGVRHELAALIPREARRAAIVTQAGIPYAVDPGISSQVFTIGDGEPAKSLVTIESLCRGFAQWGLTRADCVVAVGGGVVTDVAGFAAASYHRGVQLVSVPTTLLGMIDAAVGGKTGVNLPEGKNLVGAFWQPSGVLCDTETLATLSPREYRCGLGEMAKYHFLTGDDLGALDLDARIARCVAIKAEVVASDEREGGRRAILNYGHTLAHAIETAGSYELRHGEAVAIGLVYAAEVAYRLGRIDAARVGEHRAVLGAYDLATTLPTALDGDELIALFARDKKAIDGVTFVLDGPKGVEVVTGVAPEILREAMEAIR